MKRSALVSEVANGQSAGGQRAISDQWSVVSGQWSVVSGQRDSNGQWSVVSRKDTGHGGGAGTQSWGYVAGVVA